ncbi:hypothetical protein RRX38_01050 [Pseudomonas sp. DTU_2021_1001937_2_SI_NGA_ILE_001]|uniref:DUF6124 family protein n=1 Tax=Pseudomonas sp. DTU_2021_1001937_2_SI_NGA_ILE_001 TaxID=3077589 RepID=UPI0028FC206A|nr:hypothetical protein [Pseudomonas sp. DTU_2021_1001937_2_SI_NGA_ILE_001]WNW09791.1 hypothetical protein RRX38_01050 [Pseudomonas sp. DTU_2021_1001937_2_SI_NGA_ILE_001]
MKKLVPDPSLSLVASCATPSSMSFEDQLNHAADLLNCANATAYECGDSLHGQPRALAMASAHLIAQAQAVIEQALAGLQHLPITDPLREGT